MTTAQEIKNVLTHTTQLHNPAFVATFAVHVLTVGLLAELIDPASPPPGDDLIALAVDVAANAEASLTDELQAKYRDKQDDAAFFVREKMRRVFALALEPDKIRQLAALQRLGRN